ncbi:MAG: hypothetical protein HZA91_17395 [Verrucomicrobia bacterium]|nr:hypothetical protein [Verrucomicrobiota bacterium]
MNAPPKSMSPAGKLWVAHPLALLILVSVVWYLVAYFFHPALPGANKAYPGGWWDWWDQGLYWRSARELSQFKLTSEHYFCPLGYPAMGALFFRWMPDHIFLIPNLICFIGILAMFYRICREFVSPWESAGLALVSIVLPETILTCSLVIPWTSIPVHGMIYAIILLLAFCKSRRVAFHLAAALAALIPWFRLGDLVYLAPVFAAHLWQDLRRGERKECTVKAVSCVSLIAVSAGINAVLNWHVFGEVPTPYARLAVLDFGVTLKGIMTKAYAIFVSAPAALNTYQPMLVHRYPWLLAAAPGMVCLLRRDFAQHAGWIGAIIGCILFYLTFNGFDAVWIFKYHLIHYWAWWIPLSALLAYVGLVKSWSALRPRGVLLAAAPCILLAALVELKATAVVPGASAADNAACAQPAPAGQRVHLALDTPRPLPVSKLVIPGVNMALTNFHRVIITRDGRPLRWYRDYVMDSAGYLVILFHEDIGLHEPVTVEWDRSLTLIGPQQLHLEAYHLKFGFGCRLFGTRDSRWFDRLSLPPRPF